MAHLFGYQVADDLVGKSATDLIPSLLMPSSHDEVLIASLCGRASDVFIACVCVHVCVW